MDQIREFFCCPKLHETDGQGMVEYGLVTAFVAIMVIAVMVALGPTIRTMFTNVTDDEAVGEGRATISSTIYG